ncbi:hypothetical protein EJ110_NYTH51242 [Nymphaea thermarum]|nr:hypothetical protein EJ110_NYTH51242 [Nymphaea thermarum]
MSDPAWQWCTRVNPKNRLKVKCNYCKQIISGGISRFKHYIAGTHSDVAACNGSQEIPLPAYVKHQCQELLDAVKANRIEKDMEDAEEGYGDPNELEESEGEDVQLEEEHVGVSLGTAKGKGIMDGGGSSATATRKRRGASVTSVSPGRGRSQGRTGGGRVPTMKSSNMSGSIKNFFPNYTAAGAQPEIRIAMQSNDIIEAADETIGRWFYDASIPFNAANSYHYQPIADAIASVGRGYKMPSFHKLRGAPTEKAESITVALADVDAYGDPQNEDEDAYPNNDHLDDPVFHRRCIETYHVQHHGLHHVHLISPVQRPVHPPQEHISSYDQPQIV